MAKNRAKDVSLITFGEKFFEVYKDGGTIQDLMKACEMENLGSARQKLVKLRDQYRENGYGELPSLKHMGRSPNKGESVGKTATSRLASLFETIETAEKSEEKVENTEQVES